jgi:hypothetical protein
MHAAWVFQLPPFLHVDDNAGQPDPEHPIQGALPDLKLDGQPPTQPPAAFAGAALAGAIDEIAIARPATKNSDEAFMAIPPVSWDGKCQSRNFRYHWTDTNLNR